MSEHLSKDEELELGVLVQRSIEASEALAANSNAASYVIRGEVIPAAQLRTIIAEGERAKTKLTESYSAFVWSRARSFKARYPSAPELDDLAQEGFIGLVKAIKKYDPSRGNKLSTVAYYWIDQAIGRSTNKNGRLIRLPENRIGDFVKINRLRAELEDMNLTDTEIDAQIMEQLKLSRADFINITTAGVSPISLNRRISYDGSESKELLDFVADDEATVSSEESAMSDMMMELLRDKLQNLSEMERDIIAASFLLGSAVEKRASVNEVKDRYDLTQAKFKKTLQTALTKLRNEFEGLDVDFTDFIAI